jgi:hypothetical protein
MPDNPILEEIYAAREKLLADAGGDVHRYLEGVRKRELASGLLRDPNQQRTKHCIEVADQPLPDGGTSPATR